ncbi:hypothetical protein [Lacrimispora sphenoides]|uniref:hypothetical protein n=1 Tax=Lacrimispora sphenoides TaxID=29370 RepID=UPI000A73C30A|nr:hypothetical protein [Lacrimispora sphenoides]
MGKSSNESRGLGIVNDSNGFIFTDKMAAPNNYFVALMKLLEEDMAGAVFLITSE